MDQMGGRVWAGLVEGLIVPIIDIDGRSCGQHSAEPDRGTDIFAGFDRLGRSSRPVSAKDVAPTILAALGLEPEKGMTGADARAVADDRLLFAEATRADYQWRLAVQGRSRWLVRFDHVEPDPGVKESERVMFDLSKDPGQLRRLEWPADAELGAALLEEISRDPDPGGWPQEVNMGRRLEAPKVHPRADPEALERAKDAY